MHHLILSLKFPNIFQQLFSEFLLFQAGIQKRHFLSLGFPFPQFQFLGSDYVHF